MAVAVTAVCLSIMGVCTANEALASIRAPTNIPAQELGDALQALAQQRHFQLVYRNDVIGDRRTTGAVGELDLDEALTHILSGTGLTYRYLDERTVTIIPLSAEQAPRASTQSAREEVNTSSDKEGKTGSSTAFRVAQVGEGAVPKPDALEGANPRTGADGRAAALEEIIVTAQKREQRLQDVPVPVTALSGDALLSNNQVRIQDYYTEVPGLTLAQSAYGNPELIIRGVATGADLNPTVGVTVDDVPYGSTTALGGGYLVPDFDPSDLQRVEVLRGPQGTLYGANSLGGLFKFVTVDPSTAAFSARAQADLSSVHNGDEPGYGVRGAVNVPINDNLAIRASGFTRRDPGYIDDVETGQRAVNEGETAGARLAALWRPSDALSLKLGMLFQDSKRYGLPYVNGAPGFGDLQQSELRGTGGYDRRYLIYSAVLAARLGNATLTAISGYSQNVLAESLDFSNFPFINSLAQDAFGVSTLAFTDNNSTHKLSQEIRLAVPFGQSVDWLVGAFYTHEKSAHFLQERGANPDTGAIVGVGAAYDFPTTYEEYSAFTDVTLHVTSRFDVQLGGRESHNRQTYSEVDTGPFIPVFNGGPSPFVFPPVVSGDNAFTYLVTPQYRLSPDLMTYVRIASGYRPGGPNAEASVFGLPDHFAPDKTRNYEIGAKGDLLQGRLTFDASLYYIDWQQIQLYVVDPTIGYSFNTNAGRAKSQGLELSSTVRPLRGLTVTGWVSWDEAVLTEPIPSTGAYGVAGDRLPYTPRFSGNLSFEQAFPLGGNVTGFVGGTVAYVGFRQGEFQYGPPSVTPRTTLPPYAKADVRAGIRAGDWVVSLFGNNIADRRGMLQSSGALPSGVVRINYIQPRVFGLSIAKTFQP